MRSFYLLFFFFAHFFFFGAFFILLGLGPVLPVPGRENQRIM